MRPPAAVSNAPWATPWATVSFPVGRTTMKATEVLMQEHRVIERVLDALETAANHLDRGHPVRPGLFLEAADFIAGFADGCHHRKEEGVLFGACLLYTSDAADDLLCVDLGG